MDRDLAKHVITVGFHSLSLIEGLIPVLKEHCDDAEFQEYLKSIGMVIAEVGLEVFNKIYRQYPDLKIEVEEKIDKYGKFI
jgi:hypothetical protein